MCDNFGTMTLYERRLFPLLRRLDPERAHEQALAVLALAQRFSAGRWLLRRIAGPLPTRPVQLFGLTFPNVLGVAAGFDKDVRVAAALADLGFGHVEVGTLTPRPQAGNPRPRLFRLPGDRAIINRLGFPNVGVAAARPRLQQLGRERHRFVLGVSLGKQKETPLEAAAEDYVAVMTAVYPYADYLAVNISSPNTPALRELQGAAYLGQLLGRLREANEALADEHALAARPLLLKIAPDLSWDELAIILSAAEAEGVSGLIATNTTVSRDGLNDPLAAEAGGLSGRPLAARSNALINYIARQSRLPIIGVGGVMTVDDVRAKLDAGASLVQIYTGLVYRGPALAGRLLRGLVYQTGRAEENRSVVR